MNFDYHNPREVYGGFYFFNKEVLRLRSENNLYGFLRPCVGEMTEYCIPMLTARIEAIKKLRLGGVF